MTRPVGRPRKHERILCSDCGASCSSTATPPMCRKCALQPCGTHGAYLRHLKHNESCETCYAGENTRKRRTRYRQKLTTRRDALWKAQDKRCAICRNPITLAQANVDHDHACCPGPPITSCGNCDRGTLCRNCNVLLGYAHDDPRLLTHAAAYLEAPRPS